MKKIFATCLLLVCSTVNAYDINGNYASLIKCEYGYSHVRGESGYTGYYRVMGEIWTVYFGSDYCEY
jgi:alpha-D-ribose 1-methylphosphonate 5-triphosphate synthase subunit PhnG